MVSMQHTVILLILGAWCALWLPHPAICGPVVGEAPQGVEDRFLPEGDGVRVEAWIQDLEIPWSLVFLPDGRALVSERPGRIRLMVNGRLMQDPYAVLDCLHEGEGGLMGLALHPRFPERPYLYAMHTYQEGGERYNRVVRLKDRGDHGVLDTVIIDRIPGGKFHNGGRIAFGPDGLLYITTGETFKAKLAQDPGTLAGKILRVTDDGDIPRGNPFAGSPVYSLGHRNPQGLAWHPVFKDLFASEHGPSGEYLLLANDEINRIVPGGNYGWPAMVGAPGQKPFVDPLICWKETTPPAGMTFYQGTRLSHLNGDLFVATLRSRALIRIKLKKSDGSYQVRAIERWFATDSRSGTYGRLRDVVQGPDGALYCLTSNRDGRGRPQEGDDKIYRITPQD
jgi:glucose/arabinose dehydrogenase